MAVLRFVFVHGFIAILSASSFVAFNEAFAETGETVFLSNYDGRFRLSGCAPLDVRPSPVPLPQLAGALAAT